MILAVATDEPVRLDVWLSRELGCTRSQVKVLNDDGAIAVDGVVGKAGRMLKGGEAVELTRLPGEHPIELTPENLPLSIVYEDDALAVVDKPRGMVVHPANGVSCGTLVNALLYRFAHLSEGSAPTRPGIVHRLDKDTTGLLVVAKTDAAHAALAAQIAQKSARRRYLALVEGVVRSDGSIETQIGRSPADRKKMAVVTEGGKRADTAYEVVARYPRHTLLRFTLGTGRTHQIRVHAAYLGHPVCADPIYGFRTPTVRADGQLLHAYNLELDHPSTWARMSFFAPIPSDFRVVLGGLGSPEETPLYREIKPFL